MTMRSVPADHSHLWNDLPDEERARLHPMMIGHWFSLTSSCIKGLALFAIMMAGTGHAQASIYPNIIVVAGGHFKHEIVNTNEAFPTERGGEFDAVPISPGISSLMAVPKLILVLNAPNYPDGHVSSLGTHLGYGGVKEGLGPIHKGVLHKKAALRIFSKNIFGGRGKGVVFAPYVQPLRTPDYLSGGVTPISDLHSQRWKHPSDELKTGLVRHLNIGSFSDPKMLVLPLSRTPQSPSEPCDGDGCDASNSGAEIIKPVPDSPERGIYTVMEGAIFVIGVIGIGAYIFIAGLK